ncbi:porin [Roseateles violae]|uniref:Porin n=1 Tax=Roseateles violae TaxID=3058042 RepID=A0ABT8DT20_9BURK|nr:porin [Pelomonas sp. PFR6]MDN3921459.1 porin [Pelomonas sp. PFR6]
MNKIFRRSIPALAGLALASAAQAQSGVTIYGRIDLGISKQNDGTSALTGSNGKTGPAGERWDVRHLSENRLGFRGVEDLGEGLKAGFQIEHRFQGDTGVADPVFWKGRSYVYLENKTLGNVYLGREYIPAFWPALKLDPWGWDTLGSPGLNHQLATYRIDGHARANNSVGYKSPNFSGLTTNWAASAGEGVRDRSIGANVEYSAGPVYVAAAFDHQSDANKVALIGGAYDFGLVKPAVMYTEATTAGKKASNLTIAATVPVTAHLIKLAFARLDPEGANNKTDKLGAGFEYFFSKRTSINFDVGSALQQGSVAGKPLTRTTAFDLGLKHNF